MPYRAWRSAGVVLFALVGAINVADGQTVSAVKLTFTPSGPDHPRATFEVSGLDAATLAALAHDPRRLRAALTVYTVADNNDKSRAPGDRPTVLGAHEVVEKRGVLRFQMRFPSEPGTEYRAVYRPPGLSGDVHVATFSEKRAARTTPSTRVVRVSPGREVLPENLLKFYIEFSAPMGRGEAYEHIRLLDGDGKSLDLPFLELGEDLWDPRAVRFTLLHDPGRIKTGLRPREELGPVLEAGKRYTLVIDQRWRDASGTALAADFRKTFRVGPPDVTPPDPKTWTLNVPAAGSRSALVVTFPEPLDRAMLRRVVGVMGDDGKPIVGRVEIGADETSWEFTPEPTWKVGRFALKVDRALEDLAGNSIGRPFEVDVFQTIDKADTVETITRPFIVLAGPR